MRYAISEPSEYLVLTGAGIPDIQICKKAWVMPWQRCSRISVVPYDFSLNLQAMTIEKLQFSLPAVFTIGPEDKLPALRKYALLLSGTNLPNQANINTQAGRNHVQDIVKGIIEGETRVIVSSMTMEQIFKERQIFKANVMSNVKTELAQFGLKIYNANVKELQDTNGSEYFATLSRKAHEDALNQAKVDVAEARMRGEIGEAEKKGKAKQEISKVDADTAVLETKRKAEKAKADSELMNRQTELDAQVQMARIIAQRETEMKDAELKKAVESKRAETELETLRAKQVMKSKVERESAQENADALLYTEQKAADARLYKQKMEGDANTYRANKEADINMYRANTEVDAKSYRISKEADVNLYRVNKEADATTYRVNKEADANLYRASKEAEAAFAIKQREAQGIIEIAKAYKAMVDALGGPQNFLQLKMIESNTYEKLALANAKAIQGLQPKITTWNTGDNASGSADALGPIRNILQGLPPLLSTIQDQTGIAPPSWLAQLPDNANYVDVNKLSKNLK